MDNDYLPDWAVLFNQAADRVINNIDYLISKIK